ncbi:alanine:cation symporter family protein [Lysobacter pythonis]|uniref:Alanine:cation symporter family protein n=1 Tax=Solilutibacter pythonis TaxID=2483112 RepID=A0A3M2HT32_9GAMM|nr:alanine:cation symporter family protein [Lysobacter pythonis]
MAQVVGAVNGVIWDWLLVALLPLAGLYFSVRTGFIQLRRFPEMWRVIFAGGREDKAGISPFEALATSLASRIGTGNLVGVAIAIGVGGPGAVFWMWLIAFLGMATAYAESTLAQLYKTRDGEGQYRGGPAFYLWRGLGSRGWGVAFSLCLILAFGLVFNAVQANSIAGAMREAFAIDPRVSAAALVGVAGVIIFGGLRVVARFAVMVVPFMAMVYLALALWVLATHITEVPAMLTLIVRSALGLEPAAGGVLGGLSVALLNGVKRGLFSNEAGMGSAPNIAAAATPAPHHPASQGLVQAFGVFVDTLLVCTATALMILLSGALAGPHEGVALTQNAMAEHFGGWGAKFVAIALLFFALTSIVGNYAYAESSITFLRGGKRAFIVMRLACLAMVAWGALSKVALVWDTADAAMGLMALINLGAVLLLSGVVVAITRDYDAQRAAGREPEFDASTCPGLAEKVDRSIWRVK